MLLYFFSFLCSYVCRCKVKICRKVSQQVAVLNRLKKILPFELRINIYRAFIAPHFNYCSESWHHCGKRGCAKLDNLRGKHILELPKVNTTTYGLRSWRYTAAKIWNALPDQFRAANNIGTFKNLMSKLDFSNFTF